MFDGNSAHSTAFWWLQSGAIFIGGGLNYENNGDLVFNPRKDARRDPCMVRKKFSDCDRNEFAWVRLSNTKAFLLASYGIVSVRLCACAASREQQRTRVSQSKIHTHLQRSYKGRLDIDGFEAHDTGRLFAVHERAIWMNRIVHSCRSGEQLALPDNFIHKRWLGSSIFWEARGYKFIVSNSVFRNCGLRSDEYTQYNDSPTRGCPNDDSDGACDPDSSVWIYGSVKYPEIPRQLHFA